VNQLAKKPPSVCAAHPGVPASFRCDGCGRLLCRDCIEEGHRLLFCRLCGERALPLAESGPASTQELRRAAAQSRAYGFADALGYCFRGRGAWLFWAYLVLLAASQLSYLLPGVGLLVTSFGLLVLMLAPGLLFAIVRQTTRGDNELPDWPDFSELWPNLARFLAVALIGALPVGLALFAADCGPEALLGAARRGRCALALLGGAVLGVPLGVLALGAVAHYDAPWIAFRVDLHLRALAACGRDAWRTIAVVLGVVAAGQIASWMLGAVPLAGEILEAAASTYGLLTGAHLVGLLYRWHERELDRIYMG
jgi:hypothetical protein